jgi:hypothetical protein
MNKQTATYYLKEANEAGNFRRVPVKSADIKFLVEFWLEHQEDDIPPLVEFMAAHLEGDGRERKFHA